MRQRSGAARQITPAAALRLDDVRAAVRALGTLPPEDGDDQVRVACGNIEHLPHGLTALARRHPRGHEAVEWEVSCDCAVEDVATYYARLAAEADEMHELAGAPNGSAAPTAARTLAVESFAAIRAERTRWLWDQRVPLGTATLLVGREKLGKSTLTGELAARLSRGDLPGDLAGKPAATLIVSYEDSAARTIKPRLMAANADLAYVHRVVATDGGSRDLVSLPGDVERIGELAVEHGVRLVVVDPLSASLAGSVDAHRDQDMRRALAPLVQLAEEADLAVLALAHWNKGQGSDPLSRVLGSRGLTAAVRSVLAFGRASDDDDDSPDRVLAHPASNLGPEAPSLACRIEGREVEGDDGETIPTSRLVIGDETDATADDLLAVRSDDDRTDREGAADWLADQLADGGWHEAQQLIERAEAAGHSRRTLYRARKTLGVESERHSVRDGLRASWRLPEGSCHGAPLSLAQPSMAQPSTPHHERDSGRSAQGSCQDTETGTTGGQQGHLRPVPDTADGTCRCRRPARSPRADGPDWCAVCRRPVGDDAGGAA